MQLYIDQKEVFHLNSICHSHRAEPSSKAFLVIPPFKSFNMSCNHEFQMLWDTCSSHKKVVFPPFLQSTVWWRFTAAEQEALNEDSAKKYGEMKFGMIMYFVDVVTIKFVIQSFDYSAPKILEFLHYETLLLVYMSVRVLILN